MILIPTTRMAVLITGGHGFIGSYVAKALYNSGTYTLVRIVDTAPKPAIFKDEVICHDTIIGDLHDPYTLNSALDGIEVVLHFAANMGGMGTIHSLNDFTIYSDNHTITLELVRASIAAGVKRFMYASTACVYPEHLQQDSSGDVGDVSLSEDDAFACADAELLPRPQGLYGLEKLNTELLLNQFSSPRLEIQIARFHNVYGPGGTYGNGREKAPAALLRKAIALSLLEPGEPRKMEIWGDGNQRRSFLYIDDAVSAILKLLHTGYTSPLNIGSDESITISDLAHIALDCVGLPREDIEFEYRRDDRPIGVGSRNSNNERVSEVLIWRPTTSIERGMKLTCDWIKTQIQSDLPTDPDSRSLFLRRLLESKIVDLAAETITFAVLLPITSRGGSQPSACLENLETFAKSLVKTTLGDQVVSRNLSGSCYALKVYLAIDHDDGFLLVEGSLNKAEHLLRKLGFADVTSIICNQPKGHVCALWRDCARMAWKDKCDYYVLFGDDVTILDDGWMKKVDDEFHAISSRRQVPLGVGCVAFTDTSFPGMPTFPVIHRRHMDVFNGEVIPSVFINQDGDPFLFQLYRRWGSSTMIEARMKNAIGGSDDARYEKKHTPDWSFDTLKHAVEKVNQSLTPSISQTITLDIIIPCYRVDLPILSTILNLHCPPTLSVMFVIIVDNPASPTIPHLEKMFGHRVDVRIRANKSNLGASASRNRGLTQESSADWVHFLDDDIVPSQDLLFEVEKVIRRYPNAAGFVGNCKFPVASTIFQAAVHLAGVTYFWDIAEKIESDVPWGVTANLIARRTFNDGVIFDTRYPKTGGGEDIDFCRLKRAATLERLGDGKGEAEGVFQPAKDVVVTHPWWNDGKRSYWRFYMWAYGDGLLVSRFPELSYTDYAPNSAELASLCLLLSPIAGPLLGLPTNTPNPLVSIMVTPILRSLASLLAANIVHDLYRHLYLHPERNEVLNLSTSIKKGLWFWLVVVESTFIRMFSELGRLKGVVDRREWGVLGRRFDWFTGRAGKGPILEERSNNAQRMLLTVFLLASSYLYV
ncbi:hypothetical protein EST38_g6028 [Candolleomyces aberdarensis]|uniref:Glycosyltransferase family 2 protein n=1 Tax=Candolleomyces aberdarensis TaxID=2316362 RepID=A0A4Q2DKY4_9AGAR|nr:hypothetical protein EST38_g6028 [Candolleomyces aberdarensis]